MLDDDDENDNDDSVGVSVGDGEMLGDVVLPTGSADSSGPWLPLTLRGTVAAGSADSSGPLALGGGFSFGVCCRLCCAVAVLLLFSLLLSFCGRRQ